MSHGCRPGRVTPAVTAPLFISLLVLATLAACVRNPEPAATQAATCGGMRFVAVSNHWNRGIDVYARGRRTATPVLLGSVSPGGSREFALTEDQYVGYQVEGSTRLGVPAADRHLIRMRYLCR